MSIFPAVRSLVHDSAVPPKAIAEQCGIRYGYLMRAADDQQDDVQFQARWIAPVTRAAQNDVLIKAIAEQCGGVFYRLIAGQSIDTETAKSLREFAEYISALADATADRTVTPEEFHRTKSQAHEAIAAILARVEGLRIAAGVAE